MSWIRLDARTPQDPAVVDLPNNEARWAFVVALCDAKQQRPPGEWASERHFRACVPTYVGRYLPVLVAGGLLAVPEDGRVTVPNWSKYQVDPTGTTRAQRSRNGDVTVLQRPGNDLATGRRETDRDEDVDGSSSLLSARETEPALDAYMAVMGHPSAGALQWVDRLIETHGQDAVASAIGEAAKGGRRDVLKRTESILALRARDAAKVEQQRDTKKRDDRILEGMLARRAEWERQTGRKWGDQFAPEPAA